MDDRACAHSIACFGAFELDLQDGELRRSGVLLHLAPQPFRILVLLLSRPGEVITREEIRDQIWGSETWVDFEHGLNFAIREIRQSLGDNANSPRFIQTLPTRGYRFVADVEWQDPLSADGSTLPAANRSEEESSARASDASEAGHWTMRRKVWVYPVAAAMLLLAGVVLRFTWATQDRPEPAPSVPAPVDSVAVLPLESLSQDPDQEFFADGLTESLISDLGQTPDLRVVSRTSILQYKRGKTSLPQIAHELHVDAIVEGTVQRSGRRVCVTAQLIDARNDRQLWTQSYLANLGNELAVQHQIALGIAQEVSEHLRATESTRKK